MFPTSRKHRGVSRSLDVCFLLGHILVTAHHALVKGRWDRFEAVRLSLKALLKYDYDDS